MFQIPKDDPYPEDTVKQKIKEPEEPGRFFCGISVILELQYCKIIFFSDSSDLNYNLMLERIVLLRQFF